MIKKNQIAIFLDTATSGTTPTWTRIKKSTELTMSMNPKTEEYDYISDENPTTELLNYAPKIEQPLKMVKDENDFEYIWDMFYDLKTGEEAKTDALVVFMFDSTTTQIEGSDVTRYKAWKVPALIAFNELNAVASELKFDLAFGGNIIKGDVTVTGTAPDYVPTFTAAE